MDVAAMLTESAYDDDYPTCARTHASLRVYRDEFDHELVTRLLGIEPTQTQTRGQAKIGGSGRDFIPEIGGWFLSTKGLVESKDVRRHLDWLSERLAGRDQAVHELRASDYRLDVFCYWLSADGHGGPTLSAENMRRFGELGLEIGFDVYG